MIRNILLLVAFGLIGHSSYSQEVKYFDIDGIPTDSLNSFYYVMGNYSEATGWIDTVKSFYSKNKNLRSKELFKKGVREGLCSYYHDNGKFREKIIYRNNLPTGVATEYYSNGKGKVTRIFIEKNPTKTYHDYLILNAWDSLGVSMVKNYQGYYKDEKEEGKIKNGLPDSLWITYGKSGKKSLAEKFQSGEFVEGDRFVGDKTIHFTQREISASPKEGFESLYREIGKNLYYPLSARRMGIEGKVFIQFVIEKDGSITNVKVFKGFERACDQEAARLVKKFKPWNPGMQRGLPVRQMYTMPISFKLND